MKKFLPKTSKGLALSLSKGFTLVELLVVISIIAILSVIGLVIFSNVQKGARNAKRIADMKAIALALEAYYNDPANKFTYPCTGTLDVNGNCNSPWYWRGECSQFGSLQPNDVIPDLVSKNYMANPFPSDPQTGGVLCYAYRSNGKDYKVIDINVGVAEITSQDVGAYPNLADPLSTMHPNQSLCLAHYANRSFAVYSQNSGTGPGYAQCW